MFFHTKKASEFTFCVECAFELAARKEMLEGKEVMTFMAIILRFSDEMLK